MSFEPANSATIYELDQARTVLAALEKQEQDLLDQLRSVRSATHAQKIRVEELIRQLPRAPISRLPNELLVQIFKLSLGAALEDDPLRSPDRQLPWMQGLAGVSRHWKDTILNSPSLWTTILVTPDSKAALVKMRLHRSSQFALDIEFHSWGDNFPTHAKLCDHLLALLIPHSHRWRSCTVSKNVTETYFALILCRLQHMTFPSLTQISLFGLPTPFSGPTQPVFLRPRNCPRLKYLNLVNPLFTPEEELRVPPSVTTVSMHVGNYLTQTWVPSFFDSLLYLQLTSLTLKGRFDINGHHLPPNSVQLPLLEIFVCVVDDARVLVQAMATPNLSHMECYPGTLDNSCENNFTGLEAKFASVYRLVLGFNPGFQNWGSKETMEICLAFPNIRHLIFGTVATTVVLCPGVALHWQDLESLEIRSITTNSSGLLDCLLPWLKQRCDANRPTITITFNGFMSEHMMSSLYESLHGICTLHWLGVIYRPEAVVRRTTSTQPWLVRSFRPVSFFQSKACCSSPQETLEQRLDLCPSFTSHPTNTTSTMSVRSIAQVEYVHDLCNQGGL